DELLDFAKAAFDAEEVKDQRAVGPDGKLMHTAFRVEGCIIETGRASSSWKALPAAIHLYVRDADAAYGRALKAGGASLHEVRDMEYGERSGAVRDSCGNPFPSTWRNSSSSMLSRNRSRRANSDGLKQSGSTVTSTTALRGITYSFMCSTKRRFLSNPTLFMMNSTPSKRTTQPFGWSSM